ncbi:MAG: winged helix-turn-helix transcriptional regulator [Anaerolineales bacterium]|nr:winged helix-turn-helix transcriptional regulator [Anaerolineales bacterium]
MVASTISGQVAQQLRELINSGEYKPGDRIPSERELAERLGAGRPAVREALRELKAQGLLRAGRGSQGTVVTVPAGICNSASHTFNWKFVPRRYTFRGSPPRTP